MHEGRLHDHAAAEPLRARPSDAHVERRRAASSALRDLQRTAGNRAVLRVLQRLPVTGTVTPNPNQKHHPSYRFTYPNATDEKLFDLDKWITAKMASPAVAHAAHQPATAATVLAELRQWDGSASIIGPLVNALIAATPVNDWRAADVRADVLNATHGESLVGLLLSLKANIKMREDDIPHNVPTNINIVGTPKVVTKNSQPTKEDRVIDWSSVLKAARIAMKAKLDAAKPEWAPAEHKNVRLIDDAIMASTDGALTKLRQIGALGRKNAKDMVRFDPNPHTGKGGFVINYDVSYTEDVESFNFGMNHLRFIVFLEWTLLSELMKPQ